MSAHSQDEYSDLNSSGPENSDSSQYSDSSNSDSDSPQNIEFKYKGFEQDLEDEKNLFSGRHFKKKFKTKDDQMLGVFASDSSLSSDNEKNKKSSSKRQDNNLSFVKASNDSQQNDLLSNQSVQQDNTFVSPDFVSFSTPGLGSNSFQKSNFDTPSFAKNQNFGNKTFNKSTRQNLKASSKNETAVSNDPLNLSNKPGSSTAWKMMQKMGYSSGKGLGPKESGIVNPIETKLRPGKIGIAYKGFKEKTSQSDIIDSKLNPNQLKKPLNATSKKPPSFLARGTNKVDSSTIEQMLAKIELQAVDAGLLVSNQTSPDSTSLLQQTSIQTENLNNADYPMSIPDRPIITNSPSASINPSITLELSEGKKASTYESISNMQLEIQLGLDLSSDRYNQLVFEKNLDQRRLIQLEKEKSQINSKISDNSNKNKLLNNILENFLKSNSLLNELIDIIKNTSPDSKDSKDSNSSSFSHSSAINFNPSSTYLDISQIPQFSELIKHLRSTSKLISDSVNNLHISSVEIKQINFSGFVAGIFSTLLPLLIESWNVYENPTLYKDSLFSPLYDAYISEKIIIKNSNASLKKNDSFVIDTSSSVLFSAQPADDGEYLAGNTSNSELSPFDLVVNQFWVPKIKKFIESDWDVLDPEPALQIFDLWESPLISETIKSLLIKNSISTKILSFLSTFSLSSICQNSNKSQNLEIYLPHKWLHPWFTLLPEQTISEEIIPAVFKVLGDATDFWFLNSFPQNSSNLYIPTVKLKFNSNYIISAILPWKSTLHSTSTSSNAKSHHLGSSNPISNDYSIGNQYSQLVSKFITPTLLKLVDKPTLVIDAQNQPKSALVSFKEFTKWHHVIGANEWNLIFKKKFIPIFTSYLRTWLSTIQLNATNSSSKTRESSFDANVESVRLGLFQVADWYLAWTGLIPDQIKQSPFIQDQLRIALWLMQSRLTHLQ
ncbi:G-patch domain-containing protein [Smittium culicis]|uniref:G-patch domain-containing protein n=1 Tax=Smittium culicis TaxID=133412 RepID=A0A1R1YCT3_9FUNG|nr:G-patch domain-containing protein [Smittium culicis]